MKRVEGPQTPYEVYCYACQASFALGTRNCVHCGGRLASGETPRAPELGTSISPVPAGPGGAGPPTDAEEGEESPTVGMLRRLGGGMLWFIIVVAVTISRMCSEGG